MRTDKAIKFKDTRSVSFQIERSPDNMAKPFSAAYCRSLSSVAFISRSVGIVAILQRHSRPGIYARPSSTSATSDPAGTRNIRHGQTKLRTNVLDTREKLFCRCSRARNRGISLDFGVPKMLFNVAESNLRGDYAASSVTLSGSPCSLGRFSEKLIPVQYCQLPPIAVIANFRNPKMSFSGLCVGNVEKISCSRKRISVRQPPKFEMKLLKLPQRSVEISIIKRTLTVLVQKVTTDR